MHLEPWIEGDEPLLPVYSRAVEPPRERILVVDDDEALRRMYRLLLSKRGYDVEEAADGEAAYRCALSGNFDLILADLNMPRLDGWGLLQRLREDVRTRDVLVAYLSCEDDFREGLRASEIGAQAYISKGTRLELVTQQIHLLFEPLRRVRRGLTGPLAFDVGSGAVGPLWLVRAIAASRWTGTAQVQTELARVTLAFADGELVHARGAAGPHAAAGAAAFNAFIGAESFQGGLEPGEPIEPYNVDAPLEQLIADGVRIVNANTARAREHALLNARSVEVHPARYRLFSKLASAEARSTARLVCEQRLTPAQILATSERSPLDLEEELRELVRRGLVRFLPGPAASPA